MGVVAGRLAPVRRERAVWAGRALVVGVVVAAAWALVAHGGSVSSAELGASWQLLDLHTLGGDPVGSVWYLHTQPPLHNLVVGIVWWLPVPVAGTLFALYVVCLLACGLLLQDLLAGWGVDPLAAGAIAAFAMANPALLDTIGYGGYEVPVAALLVGALWAAGRYLRSSPGSGAGDGDDGAIPAAAAPTGSVPAGAVPAGGRWLVLASALLTLACLTRSLLHPLWLAGALALLLVARRPAGRRATVAALVVPVVLVGGWMLKNQAVFGTPTTSSWMGFNLQRGVVGPMERDAVLASIRDGAVSPQAARQPWGGLEAYAPADGCAPRRGHPAVSAPTKVVADTGRAVENFNHECYLPVYDRAVADAVALVRRYPGRYVRTRASALTLSFGDANTCGEGCTWMDAVYGPLLDQVGVEISMDDWNLPLLNGRTPLPEEVSVVLAAAAVAVVGRGAVAVVRVARRRARAPAGEVLWALAGWTVAVVVLGGDMVELGENARFRAMVDPLLIALPLGALARRVGRAAPRR